ncbi:MAG: hypothetical protein F6K26_13995 [Moorea sp. SIO2I5]|nr:hypothetical protein [Moorena sp. SIO2I5]
MPVLHKMPVPPRCPFHKTIKILPLLSNTIVIIISLFPIPDSRFPSKRKLCFYN